jgi:hypothetical protein
VTFTRRRGYWLGLSLAGFLALAGFVGWKARALFRSTAQFRAWPSDARVRYEPGAEALAAEVAKALPAAIHTVEERQYQAFKDTPTVYVCASVASYASYGPDAQSGGHVLNGRLFISPKPANTAERVPRVLTHELSHLHMEQRLGTLHWMRAYPPWFQEGLAAFVSDGGGSEGVSADDARRALATGRALTPITTSGLFQRKTAHSYGLDAHLFYREGELFLATIHDRDPVKFRVFLLAVEHGQDLESAFEAAFSETLAGAWARFVTDARRSG